MRVVLHVGLHKSGSTHVQAEWQAAFADGVVVRYPGQGERRLPGHHALVWPMLLAYRDQQPADLVWPRQRRRLEEGGFAAVVAQAAADGVETLLISSEELDRLQAADVPRLTAVLEEHEVTVLATVTRPVHRWCSSWQALVRHGLGGYPRESAAHVADYASLRPGRLAELLATLPDARRIVRLVRTSPVEPELARTLAEAVGCAWPSDLPDGPVPGAAVPRDVQSDARPDAPDLRNIAMGVDIEVLRRLNHAGLTLGTVHGDAERLIEELRGDGFRYRDDPALAERYEPPESVWVAAREERTFLSEGAEQAGVTVLDPHALLDDWLADVRPEWYDAISRREADLPTLVQRDPVDALWRAHQERAVLEVRLARTQQRLERLARRQAERQAEDRAQRKAERQAEDGAERPVDRAGPQQPRRRMLGRRGRRTT
jgi:hypothetical protein